MKRTTVFTMLLLSVLVLLVDASIAHLTHSIPISGNVNVYWHNIFGGSGPGTIVVDTDINFRTGPHNDDENHAHNGNYLMHHIIRHGNELKVFKYFHDDFTIYGDGSKSEDKESGHSVEGCMYGYGHTSGWLYQTNITYGLGFGKYIGPGGASCNPNQQQEFVLPWEHNAAYQELETLVNATKATNLAVTGALNINGHIYLIHNNEVPEVFDANDAVSSSVTDVLDLPPAAPAKPRPRKVTTIWASLKKR